MSTTKRRSSRVQKIASDKEKRARLEQQERQDLPDFSDCTPDDVLGNFAAIPQEFLLTFNTGDWFNVEQFSGVPLTGLQHQLKDRAIGQGLIHRKMYGNIPGGDFVYFAPSLVEHVKQTLGGKPEMDMDSFVTALSTDEVPVVPGKNIFEGYYGANGLFEALYKSSFLITTPLIYQKMKTKKLMLMRSISRIRHI